MYAIRSYYAADHPDYALAHSALSVFYQKLERHDEAVLLSLRVAHRAARIADVHEPLARLLHPSYNFV